MDRFYHSIVGHPRITITLFLVVTAVLALGIPRLRVSTDVRSMMPIGHPVIVHDEWARDYFLIEDPATVLIVNDGPDGVFTPATLALVDHISDEMEVLESIDGDDLVSLSAVDNITGEGDVLTVEPFFEDPPQDVVQARALRAAVFDNPMMVGTVVSVDGNATAIIGEMHNGADKVALYRQLQDIVRRSPITSERVLVAGRPVIEGEMTSLMRGDLALMFPFVILSTGVLLFLALRLVRAVILPLMVVVSSVIWAVGLMGWTDSPFFAVSTMMPILLIAIGVADGIHIIHCYLLRVAAEPSRRAGELVVEAMSEMTRPVVLTSITTAAGIGSLAASPIRPVQSLGVFTASGVMAAMVFSLTILPAILALLPLPVGAAARMKHDESANEGTVARLVRTLSALVLGRPRILFGVTAAIAIVSVATIPSITVDGSLLRNFPRGNPVKLADHEFVRYFNGSVPLQVVLEGGELDTWKRPEVLREVEKFQDFMEAGGRIAETRSIVDFIKRMNQVMNPDDPDGYRVPDDRELIAQYLLLYSLSGEPDDFDDVVDYDYEKANVRLLVNSDSSPIAMDMINTVNAYAAEHLAPLGVEATASGTSRTTATFVELIVSGQVRSLLLGVALVALLTGLMCRSLLGGLLTVMPVAIAILLNFGLLGVSGSPLGVTMALMSSMALGIGVDYAIHFVLKYQTARRGGEPREKALTETFASTGVAIFYNALVVFVGFLVLALSNFPPNRLLGLLVAFNMLVCFIGTVTLLAAALHFGQPGFVRPRRSDPGSRAGSGVKQAA